MLPYQVESDQSLLSAGTLEGKTQEVNGFGNTKD